MKVEVVAGLKQPGMHWHNVNEAQSSQAVGVWKLPGCLMSVFAWRICCVQLVTPSVSDGVGLLLPK